MPDTGCSGTPSAERWLGTFARDLHRERRLRENHLDGNLFGEPAWDILLDLFASETEGRMVRVNSACIASDVPASTALRYLNELERRGLVARAPAPQDKRGQIVCLTEIARATMADLLRALHAARRS